MNRVRWFARLLRAEGIAGVLERVRDRQAERRRRRTFPVDRTRAEERRSSWPVLLVSSGAPVARLGGVQGQLGSRLAATDRPFALLHPEAGGYRLELAAPSERRACELRAAAPPPGEALRDAGFETAVGWALARTGARAVHVEGAAGLPLGSLLELARTVPTLLAVHDFSLYCVRAHLLELPMHRFCGWCRDAARCTRCLREHDDGSLDAAYLGARRAVAAALLETAAAVIFPSEFVRTHHREVFPTAPGARQHVIAPAPPAAAIRGLPPRSRPRAHVAFVGWVEIHKGAHVFMEVVRAMRAAAPAPRFSAYGGGDPDILLGFRRLGVRVHGYYRPGTLAGRLRRDGVDVAVLPSIVPESFSLVLSECRSAAVPVVAFDFGAIAERVRAEGGGRLVPFERGAAGIADAVADVLRDGAPAVTVGPEPTDGRHAAAAWGALYRELGFALDRELGFALGHDADTRA